MLNHLARLADSTVTATDGPIGHVRSAFFDDLSWAIRYLVVDTGTWLSGREVLISPYVVKQPLGSGNNIDVSLTRQQVQGSPDVDTHRPVSRQQELAQARYYAYPEYWDGSGMWGMEAYPMVPPIPPSSPDLAADAAVRQREPRSADVHLRSSTAVTGYDIQASDESIGHVQDFIFDDESWAIRYLVVDTRNWWPGGKKVLVATHWIEKIDWATSTVRVSLNREQIKSSPEYDEALPIDRGYEQELHDAYDRPVYWDR